MQIIFIGTGGGRVNLIKQLRGTGGFIIKGSANLYVDPGPGALLGSLRFKQDLSKIDALIITHAHIDHSNDAALILEAMTGYALEKKGILIASRNSLEGSEHFDRILSRYHQSKIGEKHMLEAGKKLKLKLQKDGKTIEFELEGIRAQHDETSAFGFKLRMDGKVIGYTSDTEFFPGLPELWKGCDILIVNNLKPMHDGIPDHLASEDTIKVLKEAKPKLAIISHLGMKLIIKGAELEAQKIAEESGVRTLAARDGMVFDVEKMSFSLAKGGKESDLRLSDSDRKYLKLSKNAKLSDFDLEA